MSRTKKSVTVRFFSVDASDAFFDNFSANFLVGNESSASTRIVTIRNTKLFIKAAHKTTNQYFIAMVRERNSWQTKATRDGNISGLAINQGIIGDPYYFCVVPDKKVILGFTTGPIGSLKTVASLALEQFKTLRTDKITLSLIPKEKEFSKLLELPEYNSLHFKINSSSLIDVADDAPTLIKNLSSAPYIENNVQLSLDLECSDGPDSIVTKDNIIEIVNYLSDSESCTVLKVKGKNEDGKNINLDFGNAFINYRSELNTRNKYIDESTAIKVLSSAWSESPLLTK
ncbi:hypothetical protein [Vibrio cholerae]|uniref:hypothetical protein n=1 Tax=Vibrio cholerae TaxID=666 RepID=UPI000C9B6F0E|nr:hypothetical protein [Vibrio cholerae]EGQ8188384.1 hypothetical protein [Vibrio cholerae]EGR0355218.1 hypothetical protein [Vibrio cholerae]EKF9133366.1 hypothetical protein [Vibrio cholerae]TQQ74740.1 hypothetical protein FLL60_06715 [Vibrio cholerae]TXZ56257.1 hypothetical protein FXE24_06905 [Vibrio cholerae]